MLREQPTQKNRTGYETKQTLKNVEFKRLKLLKQDIVKNNFYRIKEISLKKKKDKQKDNAKNLNIVEINKS